MKVLIAVGGGGHFSPALAVIEQKPKDWEILLVGRKYVFEGDSTLSLEYRTAQQLGLPFIPISTGRLQRKFTKHTFASLVKIPGGFVQADTIVKNFKPDVVLSFGGYVALPVVLAAARRHLPIVIHEQTLHAGLANKITSKFATRVCISWEESRSSFPREKTVLTGNPLRSEFLHKGRMKDREQRSFLSTPSALPMIYITGGSGGAHGINALIEGCLEKLLEKYSIIHQTGDAKAFGDYDRLVAKKANLPKALQKRYLPQKFIKPDQVIQILNKADLVVARAGINTVTELLFLQKPCLLIPLPYGQRNEQQMNAAFIQRIGLGEVLDQIAATPEMLLQKINEMFAKIKISSSRRESYAHLIHTDAALKIIKEVTDAKEKRVAA